MVNDNSLTSNDPNAANWPKYAALIRAVQQAGYFAVRVDADETGDWLVCASKMLSAMNFSGRIALVSETGTGWYLATPHPYHFRVRDPGNATAAVVRFLGGSAEDLEQIDYDEFERGHGRVGSDPCT